MGAANPKMENNMKIYKLVTLTAVTLALAGGSALARPNLYPQTPAQIINDLRNPQNMTYVPANQGG